MKEEIHTSPLFASARERDHVLDSLHVGILIVGSCSEVLFSNKSARQLLGLHGDQPASKTMFQDWDIIHPDGSFFHASAYPACQAILQKKSITNVVMGLRKKSADDYTWFLVNAEPILVHDGSVKEVICNFSDITEHKSIEQKLTRLYQQLESRAFELASSTADLKRFVDVATHDLQEPLRMVTSFTQLLKKKYDRQLDERAMEYINYAVEGALRMKKLILDLLQFSNFSNNSESYTLTNMNDIVHKVCERSSDEIREAGVSLNIHPLPEIMAKRSLMLQLFEQLIGNAIKYRSRYAPVISIAAEETNDDIIFSVSDNGIGIDEKYSEKIFVLFQRLHRDETNKESTGVGLAICKKIVELHRGTIWVSSEKDKGSTFYFSIPKAQKAVYA